FLALRDRLGRGYSRVGGSCLVLTSGPCGRGRGPPALGRGCRLGPIRPLLKSRPCWLIRARFSLPAGCFLCSPLLLFTGIRMGADPIGGTPEGQGNRAAPARMNRGSPSSGQAATPSAEGAVFRRAADLQ